MRVAVIQHENEADPRRNLERSAHWIRAAAARHAELVLLPELHRSLYFCQRENTAAFDLAEPVPGPTTEYLASLAAELRLVVVGSVFEKRGEGLYHNTAVVLDRDGSLAGCYRKMHIPDDPGFHEKFYFTPGDAVTATGSSGFTPVDTSLGRIGVLVCWDQWYPEAARLMALAGARMLLYPAAIGWEPADDPAEKARQLDAWQTVQRGHAIANTLPVLVANRRGFEAHPDNGDGIDFWGNSFIAGPQGEFLDRIDDTSDGIILADLEPEAPDRLRRIWPFFRDRRIDAYEGLLRRYRE